MLYALALILLFVVCGIVGEIIASSIVAKLRGTPDEAPFNEELEKLRGALTEKRRKTVPEFEPHRLEASVWREIVKRRLVPPKLIPRATAIVVIRRVQLGLFWAFMLVLFTVLFAATIEFTPP